MKLLLAMGALIFCLSCGKEAATGKAREVKVKNPVTVSERLFQAQLDLVRAVKTNDTVALRLVIFENPDLSLNKSLDNGDTLLTYSIRMKLPLIRNILLSKGASTEILSQYIDFPGMTPLMIAAHLGDTAAIEALLANHAALNTQDIIGDTALHKAIKNGYDEAAKVLIRAGADLQIENDRYESPLETANNLGRKEISDFLQGLVGIETGSPSIEAFIQILKDGDTMNYRKLISLHPEVVKEYAAINPLALLVDSENDQGSFEIAQSLLARKVSVEGPEDAGTTPLIRAVTMKKKNLTELYLVNRPDLERLDSKNHPALYYAIENNDARMVEILRNNGAKERFEVIKDGRKISFKGCRVSYSVKKRLKSDEELEAYHRIQSSLDCRWSR
jgi:ankyrin repeat protein